MKILFIGDIVGEPGRKMVKQQMRGLLQAHTPDLVIANGENAAGGFGLTPEIAEELFLELTQGSRLALRLVGVKASDLVLVRPLSLFEPYSDRPERLGRAMDEVREKYGFGSVLTIREKMLDSIYAFEPRRGYVLKTASLTR